MECKSIEQYLNQEIAAKVISTLPDEQKNTIIAEAVGSLLVKQFAISEWDIKKMLKDFALAHAFEYAQTGDVQERLKAMAHEAVDDILAGIVKLIGREIENNIKGNYTRILTDKKYTDK